jgi:hypothetical protein
MKFYITKSVATAMSGLNSMSPPPLPPAHNFFFRIMKAAVAASTGLSLRPAVASLLVHTFLSTMTPTLPVMIWTRLTAR